MTALLISGMGPEFPDNRLLRDSSFEAILYPNIAARTGETYKFDLTSLRYRREDGLVTPLLRKRRDGGSARATSSAKSPEAKASEPAQVSHLTTFTLHTILSNANIEFDWMSTEHIWNGTGIEPSGRYDTILLSTTFIWDKRTLMQAITWIYRRFPDATLILGGQYSNLKFNEIMRTHPSVDFIIRGDAEYALPELLKRLASGGDPATLPNVVSRLRDGRTHMSPISYIDLDRTPSPRPEGYLPVVPYESMRGCPYSCNFCSFPAASPVWRYKSATKIALDWKYYKAHNGANFIKALDSTFTVPLARLRELLPKVADIDIQWEAYTRANLIRDADLVRQLEDSRCRSLFLGFESMSNETLQYMNKKVSVNANRTAFELLRDSSIQHFISFIVGYPGETPELFEETKAFLVNEYVGEFALYVVMFQDETMPVWEDAERFGLQVYDPDGEARNWRHNGMDSETAEQLQLETLRDVRWKNDNAIVRSWQHDFEAPLMSDKSPKKNAVVDKLIDRLGMISADIEDERKAHHLEHELLSELNKHGVLLDDPIK
jgi:anaerobic magnesium-protoporphyrin IX monomethyl ester cyclase